MNRSHLNGEPRAGDDSQHGQPPVLTTQVPMSWVDGKRHPQCPAKLGRCVNDTARLVDLSSSRVSTDWAHRGLLFPSISEKKALRSLPASIVVPTCADRVLAPDADHDHFEADPMPARMGPSHHESGCQKPCVVTGSLLTVTTPVARPSALSTTVTCASDAAQ